MRNLTLLKESAALQLTLSEPACWVAGSLRAAAWLWGSSLSERFRSTPQALHADHGLCLYVQEVRVLAAMWVPARVQAAERICEQLRGTSLSAQGCEQPVTCTIVPAILGSVYKEAHLQQLAEADILARQDQLSRFLHPQMTAVRHSVKAHHVCAYHFATQAAMCMC